MKTLFLFFVFYRLEIYKHTFSPTGNNTSLGITPSFRFMDTMLFYGNHKKTFVRSEAERDFSILQKQLEDNMESRGKT